MYISPLMFIVIAILEEKTHKIVKMREARNSTPKKKAERLIEPLQKHQRCTTTQDNLDNQGSLAKRRRRWV